MDRDQALTWLTDTVKATTPPALSDDTLNKCLDAARIVDSEGRGPVDDGYVETFDLDYAVAEAFEHKASAAVASDTGGLEQFTSEGSAFRRRTGSGYAEFMALADRYRARSTAGTGTISVIELQPEGGHLPRSAGIDAYRR